MAYSDDELLSLTPDKPLSDDDLQKLPPATGIRPKVKEPGYIDTALTGVVQGGIGMLSGAGAAAEWAGDITDSVGIRNAGKAMQATADRAMELPVAKVEGPSFEGTFMENPSAKKAVNIVGQALPSLAAAMATGGGTAVGLRAAGMAAPKALATGSAVAAGGLGLVEGAPQYVEAKKAGKDKGTASAIGAAATLGTAALEYLGISSLLKMAGKGAIKGAGKGIVTEGLQEGTQQFWQNLVAKVGYDKSKSLVEGMAEAVIGGSGAGGLVGAVTGRQTALKDRATEQMLTKVLKAPTTVENGIATAQTTNGVIKAPVDIIAQVVAAGVTPDELATASSEIERGVAAVTKKTKINRLPDDPSLPNAVIFNVKGKEYAYAPKEGMSRDELLVGLEGKSPGAAFNWLKKNSVQVKLEDVNAPTPNAQAAPVNEPVPTEPLVPGAVVDGVPAALEQEASLSAMTDADQTFEYFVQQSRAIESRADLSKTEKDAATDELKRLVNIREREIGAATEQQITNEIHEKSPQIGTPTATSHVTEPGYTYRTVGEQEIEAIRRDRAALAPPKSKGGRKNTKHWSRGDGRLAYRRDQEVIRVKNERISRDTPASIRDLEIWNKETNQFEPMSVESSVPAALEQEQQILNEEINSAVNQPIEAAPVPAAVVRDVGETVAVEQPLPARSEQPPVVNTDQNVTTSDQVVTEPEVRNETTQAPLLEPQATPSASVSSPTSAPQGVTSKPSKKSPKVPKAFVKLAKDIETVIKEDGVSEDFKRVPSFEAIAAYREKYPDDSPDTAMSELAWMPEGEYQGLTAPQDEMLFSMADDSSQQAAKAIFSKLSQVASVNFTGMKAQGVLNFLNKNGVKKAEIEATGLDAWLAGMKPTDKVSRDDLMGFVQANMVEVEDVVLGGNVIEGSERLLTNDDMGKLRRIIKANDDLGFDTTGQAVAAVFQDGPTRWEWNSSEELSAVEDILSRKKQPTHFSQYTEPNADPGSYREMFVTAPDKSTDGRTSKDLLDAQWKLVNDNKNNGVDVWTLPADHPTRIELKRLQDLSEKRWHNERQGAKGDWADGHSQYSDIQNPIVRVRYNTETRDGKTYLRIEEMQGPSETNQEKMPKYLRENIYQLGSKRIIAMAKEMGVDGIVFAQNKGRSAGETQADRYSLEKQVDSVNVLRKDKDNFVVAVVKDGAEDSYKDVPANQLEAYVGKDLAAKIINDLPTAGAAKNYSGLDLKVGGEGLKQLYDRQLPSMLEAYAKEKFTDGVLPITDKTPGSFPMFSETKSSGTTTEQVEQELKDFLGQGFANLVRKGKLEVVQGVEQLPEAGVPLYTKTRKIAGVYLASKKRVVLVADNIKPEDARYVMLHEGAHALLREDKVFIKQKDSILSDFERLAKTVPSVKAAMAKVPANTPEAVKVEEGLAYWLQEKANHKHSLFQRVISAIKAALYRLGIAPGRLTASDMSALFTQGTQAWSRQGETTSEFAQDVLLSVKDAGRKIQNLPAFKKWFAGSKVVDSEGRPLVVYHGTTASFEAFDPRYWGNNLSAGASDGFFFTSSAEEASGYAEMFSNDRTPGRVIPAYLAINNPLSYGYDKHGIDDIIASDGKIAKMLAVAHSMLGEDANIDGVILKDIGGVKGRNLYIAIFPAQIKSIFNDKWDGNNPDILFSRIDDTLKAGQKKLDTAVQALKNPKSKLHDLYVQYAPQWLSVTPLHTLAQTFGKTIPQIRQFAKHLDAVVASKTEIVDTSAVLYEQAEKLAEAGVGLDVFNTAAATASFNRITPWADMYDQAWVPETGTKSDRLKAAQQKWVSSKMQQATGMSYTQAYEQSRKAYEALKTEDLKQAYIKVVEHIASVRIRERNNLLAYIESVSEKGTELRANLMAQFEASFSNLHGAYWPLSRVGDFRLEYTDTEGFRTVKHYTTLAERREDKAAILKEGVDPATIKEDYKDKQPRGSVAIPQMLMGQLAEAVEKKALTGVDPNNLDAVEAAQERAQAITDDMNQIWLRWQPETSALKNSVRRKNVKGFSKEMLRSYLDYMQRHASNIAWTEQGKKIEQDIKSLADDINEAKNEDGTVDVTMQRHILNDLRNRIQALRSVSVGPVASILGKLGTAYYMTSPSIALVQMSQLGVLTLPKLSTMFGAGKASTALAKGTRDAFKKDYTRAPMFADPVVNTVYKNMREVVTDENRTVPQAIGKELGDRLFTDDQILSQMKSFTPYQMQLLTLREAMARNLLDISAAHEAYELTRGKDPKSVWNRAFKFAMLPMSLSELASRKATVLATLELAQQNGQNFFGAMNTIAEVVNDTLYSYSKENKGSAMQGGLSRVVLQFQHYRIMTGIRLAMLFRNAVNGETTEVKKAATKELVGIMGMSAAFAGTLGLPMSGLVFSILNLLLGDDDEPIDSELLYTNWLRENLGDTLGDVAASGLPTIAGADLSGRIGLSGIYGMQNEPPSGLHGRNLAAWWAASQLGPIFSVGQGWFQGYDEIVNKGNYLKGLEAATPKPIKDALKAYRIGTDGLKTGQGKRLLADDAINADEIILVALGFNADEIAKAQSAERSLTKLSTKISERRGLLIQQAAQAFVEGDDASPALEKIRNFNRSMPRFGINGGDIRPAIRKILVGDTGTTGPREAQVASQFEIPDYVRE